MEAFANPWPWYVAGPLIAAVMAALLFAGKNFGASANLRTLCAMCGAGKSTRFFDYNWRAQRWNLVVMAGAVIGAAFAAVFLDGTQAQPISAATVANLEALGVAEATTAYAPERMLGTSAWTSPLALATLVIGGFLIGFGTRYAGGCTSGHAISGLSNLQLPSLVAVVGFFAGGLLVTHLVLPELLPALYDEAARIVADPTLTDSNPAN